MTYYVSFLLLVSEIQQKVALGNNNIKDKNCSSQEVISDIESGNCDEDEDIALTFCDERNINHITVDNYVPRNNCEAEVNSESVKKKSKFLFYILLQFIMGTKTVTITKRIQETKNLT